MPGYVYCSNVRQTCRFDVRIRFAQDTLPNLRFDSGDVIIKLSDSPSDWLLLHKDVIQAGCPVLGAAMQDCWKRAEAIKVPGTDLTIQVYKFALNFIDDTLLLSGRVSLFLLQFQLKVSRLTVHRTSTCPTAIPAVLISTHRCMRTTIGANFIGAGRVHKRC